VVRVAVLIRLERSVDLADETIRGGVVGVRMLRLHGCGADHDASSVRREHVALVFADLVRTDKDARIAFGLSHDRQADTGVATGWLDNGAARLDLPLPPRG